eukprot:CAMPEP_0177690758 /NCGR_PEP_ID=MMETSP0484_2-20121128/939_1 /TAXON_ID=354590 /ORGANISM="Rhodomonas lens, Strain RHODO" /LENGTH=212 /DNA_ID=CAMNT_0019201327 /DNA_START=579 /DNA_END=1214 /DNA_ORIENTATION=+
MEERVERNTPKHALFLVNTSPRGRSQSTIPTCSKRGSRVPLLGILTGFLSVALAVVDAARSKPLAMSVADARGRTINIPFRSASRSAIQLSESLAHVKAGQHAKHLADLAMESRLNTSLRLDLSPDFQVLGGRPQAYDRNDKHVFCRTNSLGNSLSLMRRVQSDEFLTIKNHQPASAGPWSWGQNIARVGSFGLGLVLNSLNDDDKDKEEEK